MKVAINISKSPKISGLGCISLGLEEHRSEKSCKNEEEKDDYEGGEVPFACLPRQVRKVNYN